MISIIRRHPAASYFTLAFVISWGGIFAVIGNGPIPAPPEEAKRIFTRVYLAMLAGPSVAGLVMTAIVGKRTGLRDYLARLIKWRVAPIWYAVASLTAPLALAFAMLALAPFSSDFFPAFLGSGAIDPAGPIGAENLKSFLVLGVAVGLGAGFFEELGWTGFAISTLLKRMRAVSTGFLLGVMWGAWHFLAILWGSAKAFGNVPVPLFMLVALFAFLPPYRVLMVRVYERTGSLLIGILMHASLTSSMIILGPAINGAASVIYDLVFGAVLWLFVAGAVAIVPAIASRHASHSPARA